MIYQVWMTYNYDAEAIGVKLNAMATAGYLLAQVTPYGAQGTGLLFVFYKAPPNTSTVTTGVNL